MGKLLLLGFLLLVVFFPTKAHIVSNTEISKTQAYSRVSGKFKAKKIFPYYRKLYTSNAEQKDVYGLSKNRFVLKNTADSKVGLLPTMVEFKDTKETLLFTREFDYDEYGNIIFMSDGDTGSKEYAEWIKLPNGRFTKTKERIEERLGSYIMVTDVTMTYENGIFMGLYVRGGLASVETPDDIDWEELENWVMETNSEGIRTGIKGKTALSDVQFDEKGRVTFVKMEDEEEDEIQICEYVWEGDKLVGFTLTYEDGADNGFMTYSDLEIHHNAHLFDPYALVPHEQLEGEEVDSPLDLMYYSASIVAREDEETVNLKIEAVVDEEKGYYGMEVYIVMPPIEFIYQDMVCQKTDEYGSCEYEMNMYLNPSKPTPTLMSYYLKECNENGDEENYVVGGLISPYSSETYFEQRETSYESLRPIKAVINSGKNKNSLTWAGTEYYTKWKDGHVTKICTQTTLEDVNLYVVDGTLYIESSENINSLTFYSVDGTVITTYKNVNGSVTVPKGLSVVKIEADKGILTRKVIN